MLELTSPISEAISEQITISGCGSDASTNLVILAVRPSIFDVIISMFVDDFPAMKGDA